MAHPARQRLPEAGGVARVRPDEGRRARAAVQVLVAAADGEVGLRGMQIDRHRAGAVRQVPDGQGAGVVRGAREGGHVVHAAAAVVDVSQHQQRDVAAPEAFPERLVLEQLEPPAVLPAHALGDVEVGREVAAFGDDHAARRRVLAHDLRRRRQHLVEIDRGRVGDDQLVLARPDERGDLVADALRQVDPAGRVPAADQALAPFALEHLGDPRRGDARQHAERIAVEIDQPLGHDELVAQRGERIVVIELQEVVAVHRLGGDSAGSSRRIARTGLASAWTSFSGRAISS